MFKFIYLLSILFLAAPVFAQSTQTVIDSTRQDNANFRNEISTRTDIPDGQRAYVLRESAAIDAESDLNQRALNYESCMAARGSQADCRGELSSEINNGRTDETFGAPATAGGATAGGGGSVQGQATMDEIREALNTYTIPTSTRNFSLSNLNVGNEASLIISSGNEENNVIFRVIRLIAMLVGTVAILLYIVAGYFMIFSQGEDNSLTKGKQIIAFTTLGLGLSFGAYAIVQLVMGLIYFTS
jgi:hypothetical protein